VVLSEVEFSLPHNPLVVGSSPTCPIGGTPSPQSRAEALWSAAPRRSFHKARPGAPIEIQQFGRLTSFSDYKKTYCPKSCKKLCLPCLTWIHSDLCSLVKNLEFQNSKHYPLIGPLTFD
jgi:hypothetical protein